jgi:uncharacterized membrane protein
MNAAHWHLVVNHLPIIFPVVGIIVLITGIFSKSEAVKRTAFMIFIFGALTAIAAMNTGEGAEEIVEKMDGFSENYLESHEETAETFSILSYILGSISLFGLWASFKQKAFTSIVSIGILIFAFFVMFFAKQTGTTGGEIRHIEIRSNSADANQEMYNTKKDEE